MGRATTEAGLDGLGGWPMRGGRKRQRKLLIMVQPRKSLGLKGAATERKAGEKKQLAFPEDDQNKGKPS